METIDRRLLEAKRDELVAQRDRLLATIRSLEADINAVGGAIQLCEQMLALVAEPEPLNV